MNTVNFIKYLISNENMINLALLRLTDSSIEYVIDSDDDFILSNIEALNAISSARKSISDVVNIKILFECIGIGDDAFSDWDPINGVDFSEATSLININKNAFKSFDSNDIELILPNNVEYIGEYAFSYWSNNNKKITLPTNSSFTSIENYVFLGWSSNNQQLNIPSNVTSIGDYAFWGWSSNNQQLNISSNVTSIGDHAFSDWSNNDKQLNIPTNSSFTSIENYAFSYWSSNNQQLNIPSNITSIGDHAFSGWSSNNQQLIIPKNITTWGSYVFAYWSNNNDAIIFPDDGSFDTITDFMFADWNSNTKQINFPDSIRKIGNNAFSDWSNNDTVLNFDNIIDFCHIYSYAFYQWTSNTQPFIINNTKLFIGDYAFYNWANNPNVPYLTCSSVGDYAFAYWDNATTGELYVDAYGGTIGESAFEGTGTILNYVGASTVKWGAFRNKQTTRGFYLHLKVNTIEDATSAEYGAFYNLNIDNYLGDDANHTPIGGLELTAKYVGDYAFYGASINYWTDGGLEEYYRGSYYGKYCFYEFVKNTWEDWNGNICDLNFWFDRTLLVKEYAFYGWAQRYYRLKFYDGYLYDNIHIESYGFSNMHIQKIIFYVKDENFDVNAVPIIDDNAFHNTPIGTLEVWNNTTDSYANIDKSLWKATFTGSGITPSINGTNWNSIP